MANIRSSIFVDGDLLRAMAAKYVWWKTPEEALELPRRVVAQVMDVGDYDDVQAVARELGDAYLSEVVMRAEAGEFNARSWTYWHYRLGLAEIGRVPALPRRKLE